MKNDALFRAKTITGEWVAGFYEFDSHLKQGFIRNGKGFVSEVLSETLGQFRGLRDRHLCMIFDGDIIGHDRREYIFINSVNYGPVCVRNNKNLGSILSDKTVTREHDYRDFKWMFNVKKYIYLVGNIYDNPQMIKRGTSHV